MKKFWKRSHLKAAALLPLMILTGVLFTNGSWYDSECSGGQAGQICAGGGSISNTQSLINMFKAWGIDYTSLYSLSQSWGQTGTVHGTGAQIVVSATPIPDACDAAADSLLANISPPATPFVFIGEEHFTLEGEHYAKIVNKLDADCVAIEAPSLQALPAHYQNIVSSLQASGKRVYFMDQAAAYFERESFWWDTEGFGSTELYAMNTRDALMENFLNSISSLCRKTATINGRAHLDHDGDPAHWQGQRVNLTDLMGPRATVINATQYTSGCDNAGDYYNDAGGNSYDAGGNSYVDPGSGHYSY